MTVKQFQKWLSGLKIAWEEKNPSLLKNILAKNVKYYEVPGEKPYTSIDSVIKLWQEVPATQNDIKFDYKIIDVNKNIGIAHWTASFVRINKNKRTHLNGIFVIKLIKEGLCTEFRQWWYQAGFPARWNGRDGRAARRKRGVPCGVKCFHPS